MTKPYSMPTASAIATKHFSLSGIIASVPNPYYKLVTADLAINPRIALAGSGRK